MNRTTTSAMRRWSTGGTALAMAIALAACGSDDDATGGAEQTAATSSAAEDGGDVDAFCAGVVEAEALIGQGPPVDFETATPEEIQAGLAEFSEQLEPVLAGVEESAPDAVSEPVATLTGLVRQALQSGDDSIFEDPEFAEADGAIDGYVLAECGFEQIEATGVDYEYEGIPDTVPAGVVAVTFDNQGEELHEIAVVRINDDVDLALGEIAVLPEEEAMSMVTFTGVAFAAPGEADTTFLTLEPGRYGAICFVPQGTTHGTEGTGAPHFTLGMLAEFTAE